MFAGIVPILLPFASVTVTVPSSATSMFASCGRFGFAFLTASSTAFFSSGVKWDGSATSTGLVGALIVSSPGVLAIAVDGSDVLPVWSLAFAVTTVLSATLSAGIVILPVDGSTVTSVSVVVQFPSSPLVTLIVFSVVEPSGV